MPSLTEWILFVGSGLSSGCVYAVVGLGFVLVARVTGIFNFAQGAYVMLGAVMYAGERVAGMAAVPAVLLALAGATAAAGVQMVLMRNDKDGSGGFGSAIATLGYSIVLEGFALWIWGEYPISAPALAHGNVTIGHAPLPTEEILVIVLTVAALALIGAGLRYTTIGKAMQATAINQTAARLSAISTRRLALVAFLVAGLLGGMLGVASASVSTVTYDMGLSTGIVGFIAAALGEFRYPVRTVVGGLALGVIGAILSGTVSSTYSEVIVYGVLILWVAGRSLRDVGFRSRLVRMFGRDGAGVAAAPELGEGWSVSTEPLASAPAPNGPANGTKAATAHAGVGGTSNPYGLRLRRAVAPGRVALVALLAFGIALPYVTSNHIFNQTAVFALLAAVGATGLVLLMGLGGQLSLGQGMFYLLGGYCFALLVASHGWNEWLAILMAVVVSGILGLVIGLLCLRLEGINLALVTLAADLAAITIVTNFTSLTGGSLGTSALNNARPIQPLVAFGIGIGQGKTFYYLLLVLTVLVVLGARNFAKSGIGRALRAVGSDEPAAEGLGIAPVRVKLVAFVASAALAGLAGALWSYFMLAADPSQWGLTLSINLIVYIIVGGVTSVYGGLIGACVVSLASYIAISNVAPGSPFGSAVTLFISGGLLLVVLRFAPTGLIDGLQRSWDRLAALRSLERFNLRGLGQPVDALRPAVATVGVPVPPAVLPDPPSVSPGTVPAAPVPVAAGPAQTEPPRHRRPSHASPAIISVSGASKSFGGVAALSDVSVDVRSGEILAVIGPNGAGKSTLINVVSGYTAADSGEVVVNGRPVHRLSPRSLCSRGVVRTFQTPRTFGDMTALDAVTLAMESDQRFGIGRAIVRWPYLVRHERRLQRRAQELLKGLDVWDVRRPIESLPTGQQRLVDVARALAKRPACLMLDEPAAGLNDHETHRLGTILSELAGTGLGILLVEHDMDLVTAVADRVLVLDQGRVLTQGTPEDVMREESVLMAYLGEA